MDGLDGSKVKYGVLPDYGAVPENRVEGGSASSGKVGLNLSIVYRL